MIIVKARDKKGATLQAGQFGDDQAIEARGHAISLIENNRSIVRVKVVHDKLRLLELKKGFFGKITEVTKKHKPGA